MKKISVFAFLFIAIIFTFCKKEEVPPDDMPAPVWKNTFTPYLENNNQRDTVYDDENITFSTTNTPSDRYIWMWGDGTKTDTTQTIYAIHQFRRTGLNIIKLRVERGNEYGENTDSIWVLHHHIPHCGFRIDCNDSLYVHDLSHFVANINTANCQSSCNFDYQWDFGDGSTGAGYHTTHSYATTGGFMVTVRIKRCEGADTIIQKQVMVTGDLTAFSYRCQCNSADGFHPFLDTIMVQNLPYNPIKADGRILRRSGSAPHYYGEDNCNLNGCDTYTLDVYDNLDSIRYQVKIPWVAYTCLGRRME